MTRILILTATFLSAFLLFIIQPLNAKFLLPFFGGTSSVWTISVFFYSIILLLGYLYATLLLDWRSKTARIIHTLFLILAGALILSRWMNGESPILVEAVAGSSPALSVLYTLLMGVGLPVLLLASTSVLAQHLYARLTSKEPYELFALSNAGSLIGLAVYPFLLEPFTTLNFQSAGWSFIFLLFLIILIAVWRQVDNQVSAHVSLSVKLNQKLQKKSLIVLMAGIPTFLLVSITESLSKGIASFPLMWIIPLMLYLISFIVAFRSSVPKVKNIPNGFWVLLMFLPVFVILPFINTSAVIYWGGFIIVMIFFFLVSTYFHRQVYHLRPRVKDLGEFYVWLTLGGALGSGIVGLILPLILDAQVELFYAIGLLAVYFIFKYLDWLRRYLNKSMILSIKIGSTIIAVLFVFSLSFSEAIFSQRNFYGTLKVIDSLRQVDSEMVAVRSVVNGVTNHGMQALDRRYTTTTASYYGPNSGIDIALKDLLAKGDKIDLMVVGLGAGMMNAYCNKVETISYIEINPAVEDIARKYFTYLETCQEKTSITLGDGRLALEDEVEAGQNKYDVIMMDAFTDDAIPSHLLTIEAFENVYQPLLTEKGIVAFHISNKYLNLYPPIVGMSRQAGYEAVSVTARQDGSNELYLSTTWVLVTKPENIYSLLSYPGVSLYDGGEIVWSDQENSVLSVLSLTGSFLRE